MLRKFIRIEIGNPDRVFGLDIIRALAIFLVMFAHSLFLITSTTSLPMRMLFHIPAYLGVELFFVLSGFLIGTILIKTTGSGEEFTLRTIKSFWIRRWFRTLPNYYLILFSQLLLLYIMTKSIPGGYLNFFSFTQNLAGNHPPFFNEAWTLSVEEWFYFLFPLCIFACKSLLPREMDMKTILKTIIVFFLVGGLAGRILAVLLFDMSWVKGIRVIVIYRMDSIMFGVLFAYLYYYHKDFLEKNRKALFYLGLMLIFICIANLQYNIILNGEGFFLQTFLFSLCSFGMALLLPFATNIRKSSFPSLSGAITHLSIVSYSAYLIHNVMIIRLMLKLKPALGGYPVYLLFWVLTIICSTALYKLYEYPLMSLRERFSDRTVGTSTRPLPIINSQTGSAE